MEHLLQVLLTFKVGKVYAPVTRSTDVPRPLKQYNFLGIGLKSNNTQLYKQNNCYRWF